MRNPTPKNHPAVTGQTPCVPETTLSPSYPSGANYSLNSLQNSTNRLHEDHGPNLGRDNSGGQVDSPWLGGTTFLHINTLACLTILGMVSVT